MLRSVAKTIRNALLWPCAEARPADTPMESPFFALLPLDLQVHVLSVWVDATHITWYRDAQWRLTRDFVVSTICPMDIACCSRAHREQFLHLIRYMSIQTTILLCSLPIKPRHGNRKYDKVLYGHVRWLWSRQISCDSVAVPSEPLRAFHKLVEEGVQMPSVTHALSLLPAEALSLFPNCCSFRASVNNPSGLTLVDEFTRSCPQIKLTILEVWQPFWSELITDIHMHVQAHCQSLRRVDLSWENHIPADQLISALCQCNVLPVQCPLHQPLASHTSCDAASPFLPAVDQAVCEKRGQAEDHHSRGDAVVHTKRRPSTSIPPNRLRIPV